MTHTPAEIEAIAAGLTGAQKLWLTTKAVMWRTCYSDPHKKLMTFPPRNTLEVLHRLGLVLWIGLITDLGLAVRAYLEARNG